MKHIELLGLKAEDKVTKFKGVITSLSFDLYGCIQVVLQPEITSKEGKLQDGHWCDITRITLKSKKPVMDVPNFEAGYIAEGKKGCADKPQF